MVDNTFNYNVSGGSGDRNLLIDIIQGIVIAFAILVVIYLFLVVPSQVDGPSMQDNFMDRDLLLGNKLVQLFGNTQLGKQLDFDYQRGDVIIFDVESHNQPIIKRIVAEPNDTVMISQSKLYVNGKQIDENYIPKTPDFKTFIPQQEFAFITEGETKTVPEGKYFVLGDNRQESIDSRYSAIGWVDRDQIRGRVFIRFWPLSSFGLIPRGEFTEI